MVRPELDDTATMAGTPSAIAAGLRVPSKRAPWDRASGTLVRYRAARRPTP